MGARLPAGEERGCVGLHRRHLEGGVLLLQVPGGAGDGAAGAHRGHKHVHLTVRIRPDLRAGGAVVGLRVGGVAELVGDEAAGQLPGQLLGLVHRPLHALGPGGEDQLRPVGGQHGPALGAHGVGHGEDHPVAPGGRHTGQTDARIAGGGLDDDPAGLQEPLLLRVQDHGQAHPVLGGAGGIQIFQLGQHPGLKLVLGAVAVQLQQGGVADQFFQIVRNGRHSSSLLWNV